MIRINQIKLPIDHKEAALEKKIKKALHNTEYKQYKIVKRSIDARKKEELSYVDVYKRQLHVSLILRGDHLKCIGTQQAVNHAISVIDELLELSKRGNVITEQNVNYALSLSMEEKSPSLLELDKDVICHTIQGKAVKPKTLGQQKYVDAIKNKMITFGVGPAGTGKTYLAMAMAITAFKLSLIHI